MKSEECPYYAIETDIPLQRNALRVEMMTPSPRCLLKLPEHWSQGAKALGGRRWVLSGGSCLVFGVCDKNCPKEGVDEYSQPDLA